MRVGALSDRESIILQVLIEFPVSMTMKLRMVSPPREGGIVAIARTTDSGLERDRSLVAERLDGI